MLRTALNEGLCSLAADVSRLGDLVDGAVERSVDALRFRDEPLARHVIGGDDQIDALRYAIEERALVIIATQHPLVGDLRAVAATMHVATDLERIGDYAAGIARIALAIKDEPVLKPLAELPRMAEKALGLLRQAREAFARSDAAVARRVAQGDREVDAMYAAISAELLAYARQDGSAADQAMRLTRAAQHIERIGDRATNICERAIFVATGHVEQTNLRHTELQVVGPTPRRLGRA